MDQEGESRSPSLDITLSRRGDEVMMVVSGELDVATAPQLRDRMRGAIESGATKLVCDIADVRYVDSTGLSVMLMVHKRLAKIGGSLILVSPVPSVRRLFEVAGVIDYLRVQPGHTTT